MSNSSDAADSGKKVRPASEFIGFQTYFAGF
jgi:hypothetical protein